MQKQVDNRWKLVNKKSVTGFLGVGYEPGYGLVLWTRSDELSPDRTKTYKIKLEDTSKMQDLHLTSEKPFTVFYEPPAPALFN